MTVIESFAEFTSRLDPPDEVMTAARRCLLDWMGCAVAGSVEAPATLLAQTLPGDGPARLISGGSRDARTAALINGAASHTVEVDDIYSPGLFHPGVVTVPAALAATEAEGASGATLLRAIIAGYEVSNRIARAVNPAHYERWHTTATVGHFAAAVAAGVAMGLDAGRLAHAMAGVATMAAGLRHAFSADNMSKPMHAGRAAEAGVLAALAARAGVTGVLDMLEGTRGFGRAMSGEVDWGPATATLDEEWTILRMTVKAHACCGHNFATLDGIAALMREHALAPEDIAAVHSQAYRATVEICGNRDPRTVSEAQFSLPYCAAVMFRRGAVTPADVSPEALTDAQTRAIAARISMETGAQAEAAFPALRPATVHLTTTDGRHLTHHQKTRRGDPDLPLSDAEVAAKFHALADPVIGREAAAGLASAVASVDQMRDIRALPLDGSSRVEPVMAG